MLAFLKKKPGEKKDFAPAPEKKGDRQEPSGPKQETWWKKNRKLILKGLCYMLGITALLYAAIGLLFFGIGADMIVALIIGANLIGGIGLLILGHFIKAN